jgi:hypothetical protein
MQPIKLTKSAHILKKVGIYEVKEDIELKMKIDALTKKVDALAIGNVTTHPE